MTNRDRQIKAERREALRKPKEVAVFRDIKGEEARQFKQWARDNYAVFTPINGLWHPLIQAECVEMNRETGFGGVPGIHDEEAANG